MNTNGVFTHLAGQQGETDGDEAETEPDHVARRVEGVRRDNVKDDVAKVGGERDHVEEDVADGEELEAHGWPAASSKLHHPRKCDAAFDLFVTPSCFLQFFFYQAAILISSVRPHLGSF